MKEIFQYIFSIMNEGVFQFIFSINFQPHTAYTLLERRDSNKRKFLFWLPIKMFTSWSGWRETILVLLQNCKFSKRFTRGFGIVILIFVLEKNFINSLTSKKRIEINFPLQFNSYTNVIHSTFNVFAGYKAIKYCFGLFIRISHAPFDLRAHVELKTSHDPTPCEKILPLVFARQLEQKLVKSNSENTRPKILFTFTMIISSTRCLQPFMIGFTFNIVMNTLFQLIYYFYRILNFQKDSLVVSASFHNYIGPRTRQVLVIDIKSRAW